MFRGKNYKESAKLIDKQAQYEPQEAFELITKTAKAKFDETVELHVKLGVDSHEGKARLCQRFFKPEAAHRQGQRLPFHFGGRQLLLCRFHPLPGVCGQLV